MLQDTYTLPSGRRVTLAMPDLYAILATVGRVPSQQIVDVLNLLQAEGALDSDPDVNRFLLKRNEVRGMYAIAALCMVEPTLSLDRDPPAGALVPSDLSFADVEVIYWGFFRGARAPSVDAPADAQDLDGAAGAARASEGVPVAPFGPDGANW